MWHGVFIYKQISFFECEAVEGWIVGVLTEQKERFERRYWLKAQGYDIDRVVQKVAEVFEIEPEQIWQPGNQPLRVKARSLVCYWAVRELGMSGTSIGKLLGLGQPAVSRAVVRGEKLTQDMNLSLINWEMHFFMTVPILPQGFIKIEVIERNPYPDVEYESRRAYVFANKPVV